MINGHWPSRPVTSKMRFNADHCHTVSQKEKRRSKYRKFRTKIFFRCTPPASGIASPNSAHSPKYATPSKYMPHAILRSTVRSVEITHRLWGCVSRYRTGSGDRHKTTDNHTRHSGTSASRKIMRSGCCTKRLTGVRSVQTTQTYVNPFIALKSLPILYSSLIVP